MKRWRIAIALAAAVLLCAVVPAAARAATYTITVTKAGTGAGTVTSNPAGINCGGTCTAAFKRNSFVTLSAAPAATRIPMRKTGNQRVRVMNRSCSLEFSNDVRGLEANSDAPI